MPGLDPPARHPLSAGDLLTALLADRAQRQMIIEQPAQQFTPVAIQTLLKLGMREPRSIRPVQKTHQGLELLTARSKPNHTRAITTRGTVGAPTHRCIIATNLPVRQDFITRG